MKFVSRPTSRSPRRPQPIAPGLQLEPLEPRRLFTVQIAQTIGTVVVPQGNPSATPDLNAFFLDTTTLQQDLTFQARSDNASLVAVSVSGSTLNVNYSASLSGFAHVVLVATDPTGASASQTIRFHVTPSASRVADVIVGQGGRRSFTFTEPDRTFANITLIGPGRADVQLGGDFTSTSNNDVRGANEDLEKITVTGSTAATRLEIVGHLHKGGGLPAIGDITTDGSFGLVRMANCQLVGDFNATGTVSRLNIDYAQNGAITLGTRPQPMDVQGLSYANENFTSGTPVRGVSGGQWVNTDSVSEQFAAPYVRQVNFPRGSFMAGLNLSGAGAPRLTLGAVHVGGLIGGPWNVVGASTALTVGATAPDWSATFGILPSLTTRGELTGSLTVPSIKRIRVGSIITAANLIFTGAGNDLGTLTVAGIIGHTLIQATGSIGQIFAEDLQATEVFAGVGNLPNGQTLPQTIADFATPQTIGAVTLRPVGRVLGFIGSAIAAENLGRITLNTVQLTNGVPFGIIAHHIGLLDGRVSTTNQAIHLSNVSDAATLAAQLAAQHLTNLGNLTLKIV